jgi:hypothetical protein
MPVRCRGHILRVVRPVSSDSSAESKIGVAVRLEGYEYLPESSQSSTFPRVSALHPRHEHEEDRTLAHSSTRPMLG